MSLLNKFKIGDEVYIKTTKDISKIESVYCESGGIYIILENGYRASEDELEYIQVTYYIKIGLIILNIYNTTKNTYVISETISVNF